MMSRGLVRTILKSTGARVSPIPNMIRPSIGLIAKVGMLERKSGKARERIAQARTMKPIWRVMKSQIVFTD